MINVYESIQIQMAYSFELTVFFPKFMFYTTWLAIMISKRLGGACKMIRT